MAASRRPRQAAEKPKRPGGILDLLARADQLLGEDLSEAAREHGVSAAEWRVLAALAEHEGARMSELAALLRFTPTRLTKVIDRMERAELVERRRLASKDRRSIRVALTRRGRRLLMPIYRCARRREAAVSRALGASAMRKLKTELTRLIDGFARLAHQGKFLAAADGQRRPSARPQA